MFCYSITTGDLYAGRICVRPRTCFIMTQIARPLPSSIVNTRRTLRRCLSRVNFDSLDTGYEITGRDFLNKIWDIILSVPLGIGVITDDMTENSIANVFYEIGLMQAIGKETLVIKTPNTKIPSDLVRTEYIEYSRGFTKNFNKYMSKLQEQADYYYDVAEQLSNNPILAIDYMTRAYLITGKEDCQETIKQLAVSSISETNPIIKALIGITN